ncbi:hypothetical protein [Erythrobacter aurantius]|uniref:hypothetical protein n=2 Tax=Erythrobacter TaxID=1041 RepID=UPI002079C8F2|nr:hypothetical protein [Erythrobacter aurantius]
MVMDGGVIALAMGGLINFGVGAYFSATGEVNMGIVFMAIGLALQVLSLARIKKLKKKGSIDAGR